MSLTTPSERINVGHLRWLAHNIKVSTYQTSLRLDEWSPGAIHLMVQTAGIAEIVASAVPTPERCAYGPTIDALSALAEMGSVSGGVLRISVGIVGHHLTGGRVRWHEFCVTKRISKVVVEKPCPPIN